MLYCFSNSSINKPKFSDDFKILVMSPISLFDMNKVNPFPSFTAPFALILLSSLNIAFEAAFEAVLLTNLGNLSLLKEYHN